MSEQSQYYYFSISEAKIRIARTYYLNLIYFCRKYAIFTRFYEFMLQKVLKFANYAVAVLVLKIMLSCSNYAKNYASTIRQCLIPFPLRQFFLNPDSFLPRMFYFNPSPFLPPSPIATTTPNPPPPPPSVDLLLLF